jgi:hypothetical protein
MVKVPACLLCFATTATAALGQTCTHPDLSDAFIFQTETTRFKQTDEVLDSCMVTIKISHQQTGELTQTIRYTSSYFFGAVFKNCGSVRSYSTGKRWANPATDYDYGDLIVADFNFDGKDDFAAKNDSGGNGGPLYNYYLQGSQGKFVLNRFLTQRLQGFPTVIDKHHKTLTLVRESYATSFHRSEQVFRFDARHNRWEQIAKQSAVKAH